MAAGLAAELQKNLDGAEVSFEPGKLQSEFAVFVDDEQIFSRLEQMRYPVTGELVAACRARG